MYQANRNRLMKTYNISERSLLNFLDYAFKSGKIETYNSLLPISEDEGFKVVKTQVFNMVEDNDAYFKALHEDLKPKFHED